MKASVGPNPHPPVPPHGLSLHACNSAMGSRALGTSASSRALNIDELLSIVFTHCLKEDGEEPENSGNWRLDIGKHRQYPCPSGRKAPLLLAHVCRHWRNVALNTPKLWAQLSLEISQKLLSNTQHMENRLCALQSWLANSRFVPISVRLCLDTQTYYKTELADIPIASKILLKKMAETLSEHAHRWENIEITFPLSSIMAFYDNIDQNYPHLNSLKLETCSLPQIEETNRRGNVFVPLTFPLSLRSLELSYMEMQITQSMHGSHLRKLVLKDVLLSRDALVMFPTAFPLLEKFSFILNWGAVEDVSVEEIGDGLINRGFAVLDHLTSLSLSVFMNDRVHLLTNSITTPALTHLAVSDKIERSNLDTDIIQLLRRSRAPVKYFFYGREQSSGHDDGGYSTYLFSDDSDEDEGYEGDDNILLMLKEMPILSELEVIGPALSRVIYRLTDPTYLPRLTKIYNDGALAIANISDGSPLALPGPGVSNILSIIRQRCRKRHAFGTEGRIWLQKLSLPVHKGHERLIRKDKVFLRAELEFKSTHDCPESSDGGEDFDDYL